MAQTANVCVSTIPVISGCQDVLQSAVLRDVVRQSVDHAPKTHNNKITLRKEARERERERMSLAGTRHAAGHKRQRAFPRVCSSAVLMCWLWWGWIHKSEMLCFFSFSFSKILQ